MNNTEKTGFFFIWYDSIEVFFILLLTAGCCCWGCPHNTLYRCWILWMPMKKMRSDDDDEDGDDEEYDDEAACVSTTCLFVGVCVNIYFEWMIFFPAIYFLFSGHPLIVALWLFIMYIDEMKNEKWNELETDRRKKGTFNKRIVLFSRSRNHYPRIHRDHYIYCWLIIVMLCVCLSTKLINSFLSSSI